MSVNMFVETNNLRCDVKVIKWSYGPHSHECNFSYCIEEPEKFSTSTEFEPMTLQFQCDALNNWAMKPQMVGAGHLWVQMFLWWMKQWRKISDIITNFFYMKCGYEIK